MKDEVRDLVRQWIAKADIDWRTVEILSEHRDPPISAICFHCQQYVEKLLKAVLTAYQIEAPRTHDLRRLIDLAALYLPVLTKLSDRADTLSVHAGKVFQNRNLKKYSLYMKNLLLFCSLY